MWRGTWEWEPERIGDGMDKGDERGRERRRERKGREARVLTGGEVGEKCKNKTTTTTTTRKRARGGRQRYGRREQDTGSGRL